MMSYKNINSHQGGFAIITAVFVLVIVAAIAGMMGTLIAHGKQENALSLQESRAYYAAVSGLDWTVSRLDSGQNCAGVEGTLAMGAGTLFGSQVVITCTAESFEEGSNTITIFSISSVASLGQYGPDSDPTSKRYGSGSRTEFVSRQLSSSVFRVD